IARRCAGVTSDRYSGKARLESATASAFSISASSLSMCRHATDKRRAWFELRDCSGIKLHGRRKPHVLLNLCAATQEPLGIRSRKGTGKPSPYQENSFFFVGVICPIRAVNGELQHPARLWQAAAAKSIGR